MAYSLSLCPSMDIRQSPFMQRSKRRRAAPLEETTRANLLHAALEPSPPQELIVVSDNESQETEGLFQQIISQFFFSFLFVADVIVGAPSLAEALQREFFSLMKVKIHAHLSVYKPFPTRLNIGEPTARFAKWNKIEFDCTPSLFGALFPSSALCVQLQPRENF